MAWFDSGRTTTVTYEFTLNSRHAAGPYYPPSASCKSGGTASGPNFYAELRPNIAHWPDGTVSLFTLFVEVHNFVQGPYSKSWTFSSTPIQPPTSFDVSASATVQITFPVREQKEVRIPSPPGGEYDWLPPDVELAYALHPDPEADIQVVVTSSDTHLEGSGSYPASNFAPDNNHAPRLNISLLCDALAGGPRNLTGRVAAVTGASCSIAGITFLDSGTPQKGFDVTTPHAHCWTTSDSVELDVTDPAGIPVFSVTCTSSPDLAWKYDGEVLAFDEPYPGDPVLYDYALDVFHTAPGGLLEATFSARQFSWSYLVDNENKSAVVNEQPAFLKLHLDEDWCLLAGEDDRDLRIPLEDDHHWNALELLRQESLQIEPLDDPGSWTWMESDTGEIAYDASLSALMAAPTTDDNGIVKLVEHDLGTYRYLKVDLRADSEATPLRVVLGEFFWDVLVEQADTWETKKLDLAAPHNATSFEDVTGLQDIEEVRFTGLQPEITYWLRDMRVSVESADHFRALPPFQKEQILFHDCDRRPGFSANFRNASMDSVADAINNRTGSGFEATAVASTHSYYNPDAPAAFLEELMETVLPAPPTKLTLKGLVRAD